MHACGLIHAALSPNDPDYPDRWPDPVATEVRCAVTGEVGLGVARALLLGKSFCDQSLLARPQSEYVSVAAWVALKYKWQRKACWWCDGETLKLYRGSEGRIALRKQILHDSPDRPWAGYVTTSYKKHGALRAPVNTGRSAIWQYNDLRADLSDRQHTQDLWDTLMAMRMNGVPRSVLESLDTPTLEFVSVSANEWMSFKQRMRPIYQGGAYKLLCYLLPSQEEIKEMGN